MLGTRRLEHIQIDLFVGDPSRFVCDIMVVSQDDLIVYSPSTTAPHSQILLIGQRAQQLPKDTGISPFKHLNQPTKIPWERCQDWQLLLEKNTPPEPQRKLHVCVTQPQQIPNIDQIKAHFLSLNEFVANSIEQKNSKTLEIRRITFLLLTKEHYRPYQEALFASFPESSS